jgi:predicted aspartyl protease
MKFSRTVAATLVFTQMFGGVALPSLPSFAEISLVKDGTASHGAIVQSASQNTIASPNSQSVHQYTTPLSQSRSATPAPEMPVILTQQSPSISDELGQELLQQLVGCLQGQISQPQQPSMEALEAASMQCVFKVVMLAPDGSIRPDASERLTAMVRASGITLPKPSGQGQAAIQLQRLAGSQVFTLPVTIGGQSQTFLFDTGASNSIVDSQIAKQLGLAGTPIPKELLQYMVVGKNCSEVNATLHSLPALAVEAAKVEGINGMGLPRTAIIGNLSGVLGLDFLSNFDVVVNPKTLQLKLLPPSSPTTNAIPLKGKLGLMTVQVQINGQGPFTFLVDSGAEVMVVSQDLAKRLSLDVTKAPEIDVRGFCGLEKGKQIQLAQVSLQQHQSTNLKAVILGPGVLNVLGVDGVVGQNFLNQYQQHWRFGQRNELGFSEEGSLVLSPL